MRSTLAIAALLAGALTISGGALAEQSSTPGSDALTTSPAVDPVQSDKGSQVVPENPSGDTSAAQIPPTVGSDKGGQIVPPPNTAKD